MTKYSIFILAILLISALSVVTIRHQNRLAFIHLQDMQSQRSQLQFEYGRLVLEKATWTMQHNIADAGHRLEMSAPPPEKIITVQLGRSGALRVQ